MSKPVQSSKSPASARQSRSFVVLLLVVAVAGIGTLAYLSTRPAPQPQRIDTTGALPDARGHVLGDSSAGVEITMFGDFECPGCGQFATVTEPDVRARIVRPGLARFRFMDFPLQVHPNSLVAYNAAACAGAQNRFWEMNDRIYAEQANWSALAAGPQSRKPEKAMSSYAKDLGLDVAEFGCCLAERRFQPQILANLRQGERLGVHGTPTFVIGNRILAAGAATYDQIKAIVDTVASERGAVRPAAK